MRRRAVLCVLALVAASCGGDDDTQSSAADPVVIRSDDGRATLALPEGVDGDGITIEAIEAEGAVASYELLPAGTTFAEPARLTVELDDVDLRGPVLATIESEGGELDLLDDVTSTVADDATTVEVPVSHFSKVTLGFWWRDLDVTGSLDTHFGEMAAPTDVGVGVPFDVAVAIEPLDTRLDVDVPWWRDLVVTLERTRASGGISATNATPARTPNLPPPAPLDESYRGAATLRCTRPGPVGVRWEVTFDFELAESYYQSFATNSLTRKATLVVSREIRCERGATTTTSTSTTTTTVVEEPLLPIVHAITIDLRRPVTTYSIEAEVPDGSELTYQWRLSGESCGTPTTPWEQAGEAVTWSHADTPPDSCPHQTEDHEVTGSVRVTSSAGAVVTCTFGGSASKVLTDPPCT